MPQQQTLSPIGADVTALLPPVGQDVSSLMAGQPTVSPATAPAAPRSGPGRAFEMGQAINRALLDLGVVGPLKGAGQTVVSLGRLIQMIPGVESAIDTYYQTPGLTKAAMAEADKLLAPTSTAQTVGKFGEQIGEMLVPSKAITTAATKAAGVIGPRLTPLVGRTVAEVAPRAAVEAVGAAGMSAAQGGSPEAAGALGAAVPVAGRVVGAIAPRLEQAAAKGVQRALGATKEKYKAIAQRIVPQVLKRGLRGSREGLLTQATERMQAVDDQLDVLYAEFGTTPIGTTPVVHALEQAKEAFRTTSETTGRVVEFDTRAVAQLTKLQGVLSDLGNLTTVNQLRAVRQAWDRIVEQAGGYSHRAGGAIGLPLREQTEAWAKREGASAIRAHLAANVPDLAAINKEFTFWKNLSDVLSQTVKRTGPQGPGLLSAAAETGGQVVGGLVGSTAGTAGTIGGAVALGKLAKMVNALFRSPRWQLISANLKQDLADAIMSNRTTEIAKVISRIGAVQASKAGGTP